MVLGPLAALVLLETVALQVGQVVTQAVGLFVDTWLVTVELRVVAGLLAIESRVEILTSVVLRSIALTALELMVINVLIKRFILRIVSSNLFIN